jgi:hypothetical protein
VDALDEAGVEEYFDVIDVIAGQTGRLDIVFNAVGPASTATANTRWI